MVDHPGQVVPKLSALGRGASLEASTTKIIQGHLGRLR